MNTKLRGFTLIELMVAVAILGILAAIAYPNYMEHVRTGHRTAARAALLDAAQALERYYSINGTYLVGGSLASVYDTQVKPGGTVVYELAASAATNDSYTLQATGKALMASDACGTYSVTHTGVVSSSSSLDKCL